MKDRENKRRDENVKLIKEGKTEIQRIMKEIEKHNEIERNKVIFSKSQIFLGKHNKRTINHIDSMYSSTIGKCHFLY